MAATSSILGSSLARKYAMALSGLFLVFFLLQHLTINFTSVVSPDTFNELSHFMGTNFLVQALLQPLLIFGVIFHLGMGIRLELMNRKARPQGYAYSKPSASSSWVSRNMIITGITVMLFLALHFYDFWLPELKIKFIDGIMDQNTRYYPELVHKFENPVRVGIYVLSFIFLSLHLLHGFQSAFQTMGARHPKYTPIIEKLGTAYAVLVPFGFIVIAIYHFLAN